ncbi:DoxX family protein [Williamsia sp. CHRR-6]|uniref:DoxX family protein n=1 Tax=Williamsia sp. CHRR-6 TaxID=2835871 RepID=UPI001BDA31AD|nr:DoxX family protein [Williamsia sp. CHRR-6]MBT0566359.1 DoxX family protein [Williamsia sp. CHRR-6]
MHEVNTSLGNAISTSGASAQSSVVRDLAVLVARIGIGVIFLAHGLQKLDNGYAATKAMFTTIDAPVPAVTSLLAIVIEVGGGAALILGLLTPLAGIALALNMLGAYLLVHMDSGLYVKDGGYEFVLALGVASLLIAAVGAGRFSLDAILADKVPALSRVLR